LKSVHGLAGSTNDLHWRAAIPGGYAGRIIVVPMLSEPGMESASQQTGADTPPETRMNTLKFRSLITCLASLLATVTAIVIAVLPAMLSSAT
jgi:hypothetical protein